MLHVQPSHFMKGKRLCHSGCILNSCCIWAGSDGWAVCKKWHKHLLKNHSCTYISPKWQTKEGEIMKNWREIDSFIFTEETLNFQAHLEAKVKYKIVGVLLYFCSIAEVFQCLFLIIPYPVVNVFFIRISMNSEAGIRVLFFLVPYRRGTFLFWNLYTQRAQSYNW